MNKFLTQLPWDSSFLKFPVARLRPEHPDEDTVRACLAEARGQQIRLLYWLIAPDDLEGHATAKAIGAHLADEKVTFVLSVPTAPPDLPAGVEVATTVTPKLTALALQAGHMSRFQTDSNFAPDVYERLYTQWIQNSVQGSMAREVLVYRPDASAEEAGLITLGVKNNRVDIGLLAVDAQVRGQAIGSKLIAASQQRTRAWGYDTLQVVTQLANVGACRFYERCGFQSELVEHVYHVWLH